MKNSKSTVSTISRYACIPCKCCLCCLERMISIQMAISLCFLFSLLSLGCIIITIFYVFATSNVERELIGSQKRLHFHIHDHTENYLNEGIEAINSFEDWVSFKDKDNDFDFGMHFNTDSGKKTTHDVALAIWVIQRSMTNSYAMYYGSKSGYSGGAAPKSDCIFGINSTRLPWEQCCPYTAQDLLDGTMDNLPPSVSVRVRNPDFSFTKYFPVGDKYYDFRVVNEWTAAAANENSTDFVWTHEKNNLGFFQSNLARNVHRKDGVFQGVVVVQYGLMELNHFMEDLELEDGTLIMINKGTGLIFASSLNSIVYSLDEEYNVKETNIVGKIGIPPKESSFSIIRDASEYVLDEYASSSRSFSEIDEIEHTTFTSEGKLFHLSASSVGVVGNFNLLNIYVIEDSIVYRDIYDANILTITLSITLIFVIFVLSSCLICFLLCPLNTLASKMKKAENIGSLGEIRFCCFSPFFEVRSLQKRFRFLVKELEEYSSFLPSYMKEAVEEQEDQIQVPLLSHVDSDSQNSNSEQGSTLGSSSHASHASNESDSPPVVSLSLPGLPQSKFDLGFDRRSVICLFIQITNWAAVSSDDPKKYSELYSHFLESVVGSIKPFGSILNFNVNQVVAFYKSHHSHIALECAKKIKSDLENNNNNQFQVVIGICKVSSIQGVLGTSSLKMNVLFDGVVERAKKMTDYYLKFVENGEETSKKTEVSIIFDHIVLDDLKSLKMTEFSKPVDIIFLESQFSKLREGKDAVVIWEYVSKEKKKTSDEETNKENEEDSNSSKREDEIITRVPEDFQKGFIKLMRGKIGKGGNIFKKLVTEGARAGEDKNIVEPESVVVEINDDVEEESRLEKKMMNKGMTPESILEMIEEMESKETDLWGFVERNRKVVEALEKVVGKSVMFLREKKVKKILEVLKCLEDFEEKEEEDEEEEGEMVLETNLETRVSEEKQED